MNRANPVFYRTRAVRPGGRPLFRPRLGRALALSTLMLLAAGLLPAAGAAVAAETEPAAAAETVNINKADAATLAATLNGVGPSRAEDIIRYREAYGPFKSVDELLDVKGIGQSTLDRNRAVITLE